MLLSTAFKTVVIISLDVGLSYSIKSVFLPVCPLRCIPHSYIKQYSQI